MQTTRPGPADMIEPSYCIGGKQPIDTLFIDMDPLQTQGYLHNCSVSEQHATPGEASGLPGPLCNVFFTASQASVRLGKAGIAGHCCYEV
jgi:hypothetical protein